MPRNERWYENPDWSHPYETCGSNFKTDYDYQGYLIQTAINEIIDRIADDWL